MIMISNSGYTDYTGTTIWRVLIRKALVAHLPEICLSTSWWYGRAGHVYCSPVDDPSEVAPEDEMFEISVRHVVDPETNKERRYSWGIPATKERVEVHFTVDNTHHIPSHSGDL
jgi:salicylate hydroxylase